MRRKNAADREALLKTEQLRATEQKKFTAETQASLMKASSAQPPLTLGQALQAGAARPDPPVVALLPPTVTLEDLQQHVARDVHFRGNSEDAATFAQCMLDYMHLRAREVPTHDASMAEANLIEFSDFSEAETENAATSAVRVKKKYKMTQAQRDARIAKKTKLQAKAAGISNTAAK